MGTIKFYWFDTIPTANRKEHWVQMLLSKHDAKHYFEDAETSWLW